MRVAIVHYWLVAMRGGEKVLEALCECFHDADIYTHVYNPNAVSEVIRQHRVQQTFIASLPRARRYYQKYLPLMPYALEQLDLSGYDLVISSESGPAKGVLTNPETVHVCYCHTPMRYLWSNYHSYKAGAKPVTKMLMPSLTHALRLWDVASAARVDHFIANSANVANRIQKYYRRDAEVIYPPVDTTSIRPDGKAPDDFYLHVGQLVQYKRVDVVIRAFNKLGRRLVVIGDGPETQGLRKLAGPTVEIIGWQNSETLARHYSRCRALIFAADEDFGIVPVEAMSAGRPVIAYRRGGALETVNPGVTGLFFDRQEPEALVGAVERFEEIEPNFDSRRISASAQAFSREVFKNRITASIDGVLAARRGTSAFPEERARRAS
jgi:glycosyltransferase involved in cell wall biosynthesis